MSWVYCDPKSRMRIVSRVLTRSVHPVVGRLFGDDDVVHVALAQTLLRDSHEGGVLAHGGDRLAPDVAHGRAEAADQLVEALAERPLVRHAPLDPLGDELVAVPAALEVAVARAGPHGADRAHAAVRLVAAPLVQDD